MSYLSMMESTLPPGFRFHPRDEELVCDYLAKKINASDCTSHGGLYDECPALVCVDLNKCEPWDLPENACVGGKEWYFYSQRDRKYATGHRTNRATLSGYWKATGKDKHITQNGVLIGMRKTLVFYQGRAPKGTKTDWVMHEFRMESFDLASKFPQPKEDWVLCRVFYKDRGMAPTPNYSMMNAMNNDDSMLVERYITFDGYDQVPCFSSNTLQNPMAAVETSVPVYGEQSGMECFKQVNMNQVEGNDIVVTSVLDQLNRVDGKTMRDVCIDGLGEGNLDVMMLS